MQCNEVAHAGSCLQADERLQSADNGSFVVRNDLTNEQALVLTYVSDDNLIDLKIRNTTVRESLLLLMHTYPLLKTVFGSVVCAWKTLATTSVP